MIRRAVAPLVLVALTVAACSDDGGSSGGRLRVVATTTQLGDIARQVAGARADVHQILRPNSDPHTYEPRPSDARALAGARLVLRSGGDVDNWLGDLVRNAGSHARTVTIIDSLQRREVDGDVDPHWWQDPADGETATALVRDALIAVDPAGRAGYTARAVAYTRRLRALDGAISACARRVPAARRLVVTDHDALGYFAGRYGIRVIGTVIPALSTQAQASAGEIDALIKTIRRTGVSTIFPESSVNPKLAEAIAKEAGARVGAELYADTLGPAGTPAASYLGALRFNASAILASFGGAAQRCVLPG